jgi:hypothetical protein
MQTSIILRVDQTTKEQFQNALEDRSMSAFLRQKINQLIESQHENRPSTRQATTELSSPSQR